MQKLSAVLFRAIETVFLRHAVRTGVGAALGAAVYSGILLYFHFALGTNPFEGSSVYWWHFSIIGSALMLTPVALGMLANVSDLDENIDLAFKTLKRAEKEGADLSEIQKLRLGVCETALSNASIRESETKKAE